MRAVDRFLQGRPAQQAPQGRRVRRAYDLIVEKHGPAAFWPGQAGQPSGQGSEAEKANDLNVGQGGRGGRGPEIAPAKKRSVTRFLCLSAGGSPKYSAYGLRFYPDHPDHPDRANNSKGLTRSGRASPPWATLTTPSGWGDLDAWRRRFRDLTTVAVRREIVAEWAEAAGGSVEDDVVTLPLGLRRGLALAELKTQAMIAGLKLVERAMDCAWCPNTALPGDALCEHCRWLAGAQP